MQIEETLDHEETTLVSELAMEEELQFCTELSACHAQYVLLLEVILDSLNVKLVIKSEALHVWLSTATLRKLHPELLESLRV